MSMDVKELLNEEEFDPKKLFDEKEYSTVIINREGFNKKENTIADLVESLLDKDLTREQTEEIFSKLKDANAQQLLVDAIKGAKRNSDKITLTSACWETGLDFSKHFLFFVELACSSDFKLALEGLTVVESCEGTIDEATLTKALTIAGSVKNLPPELAGDLMNNIKQRIS